MSDLQRKNGKTLLITLGVVVGMVGLSFASVPLYRKFCQVTGWGGTPMLADASTIPAEPSSREMVVQFNTDVAPNMPWRFKPEIWSVKLKVGQSALVSYQAENKGDTPVVGTAVYNVTPLKAGKYFNKIECFCFGEQVLKPGEKVDMPVAFFIDPKILEDREMRDLKTITLSYTFYRHDSPELEKAVEKFVNEADNPVR